MRAWLYDELTQCEDLWPFYGGEEAIKQLIIPRRGKQTINLGSQGFIIFGLGHLSEEDISEDPDFEMGRQFFQIWVHDPGPSYQVVDEVLPIVKKLFRGRSEKTLGINQVRYLETSQEFNNETYNTVFRYIRFQAIIAKQGVLT